MNLKRVPASACCLCLCAVLSSGCRPQPSVSSGGVTAPPTEATVNTETPRAETAPRPPAHSKTPIKDALEALLIAPGADNPFPQGTRLNRVSVRDGVATLDFSAEFSQLANKGETVESRAQKQLRQTLETFPSIEKMRVTVEGRPFKSQATDWTTPFAVRAADYDLNEVNDVSGTADQGGGRP